MSLKPAPAQPVPEETVRVAVAAFPKGNPYLLLRDELGTIFEDEDFTQLYPGRGQPGLAPWRLALVTIMQFRENLSDRQAAEQVRARIDWKYLLGLELTDPGFDFSVLSEFRSRLLSGEAEQILLDKLLERCHSQGLVKARGKQRTDATYVLAAIRVLNRLELIGETLRATLNAVATVAPDWLRDWVPTDWYKRYGRRIEDAPKGLPLPEKKREREAYAYIVGVDGFTLLDKLRHPDAPPELKALPEVEVLRLVWERHFERRSPDTEGDAGAVRFKENKELARAAKALESPYDPDARFRSRYGTSWTGYVTHLSESCEEDEVHLVTHVETTAATVHEVNCTQTIQQELVEKGLPPGQHIVDSAYIDATLLVSSQKEQGITLVGPTRPNGSWQARQKEAYDLEQFEIDWAQEQVRCPQGKLSTFWGERIGHKGMPYISAIFSDSDCSDCTERHLCTRSKTGGRRLRILPREEFEALQKTRQRHASFEGKELYKRRAGIEGTISQGVRAYGLRQSRYRGLAKNHLQHVATAAAINIDRLFNWFLQVPHAKTRTSRFAALAV